MTYDLQRVIPFTRDHRLSFKVYDLHLKVYHLQWVRPVQAGPLFEAGNRTEESAGYSASPRPRISCRPQFQAREEESGRDLLKVS